MRCRNVYSPFAPASGVLCAGVLARLHEIKGIIYLIRAMPTPGGYDRVWHRW